MPRILTFNCVAFLLWQLMYLNFANAQVEILRGMIKDKENVIHLNWKKTKQLLANEHLPVWTAIHQLQKPSTTGDEVDHIRRENFMRMHIGEFVFYHDEEKSSAIVHFKRTNTISGFVGTKYLISDLPVMESNYGHQVGGPYVLLTSTTANEHLKPFDFKFDDNKEHTNRNLPRPTFNQAQLAGEYQRVNENHDETKVTNIYPEILLFVAYDVQQIAVQAFKENYLTNIVRYQLMYFNAIDMLFAKLSNADVNIHLNLAGIVIEDEPNVFSFMKSTDQHFPFNILYLDAYATLQSVPHYINANKDTFSDDAFDYFFITTNNQLWNNNQLTVGKSILANTLQARQAQLPVQVLSGVIISHNARCGFAVASQEIAHLMFIQHDPREKGHHNAGLQCYSIMQESDIFCDDCLKWSNKNTNDLKIFAKFNSNHCFLLNTPRSLRPFGHPMKTLFPSEQCRCYGIDPRTPINTPLKWMFISPASCKLPLFCGPHDHQQLSLLPLDGTPCGVNMVCWNKECQLTR